MARLPDETVIDGEVVAGWRWRLGQPVLPIAVHSPRHVAATDARAREHLWPRYEVMINRIGGERG